MLNKVKRTFKRLVNNIKRADKKKKLMVLGGFLGVILLVVIIVILFMVFGKSSNESALKERMKELGVTFYEEFYYQAVGTNTEERTDFLKDFKDIGIKVDLNNLARYAGDADSILEEFVNEKTDKKCDAETSQVVIYPEEPYEQKTYKMEVNLDCGFEKEK